MGRKKKETPALPDDVKSLALAGDAEMQFQVASYYDEHGKQARDGHAVYWYTKAADQGHVGAQYQLVKHLAGHFWSASEPEITVAFDLLTKAAEQGHPEAQYELGECYNQGYGVESDPSLTIKWWKKAAENGNLNALCALGEWHEGEDIPLAIEYYRQAAAQGHCYAQKEVDRLTGNSLTDETPWFAV